MKRNLGALSGDLNQTRNLSRKRTNAAHRANVTIPVNSQNLPNIAPQVSRQALVTCHALLNSRADYEKPKPSATLFERVLPLNHQRLSLSHLRLFKSP